MWLNKTPNLVCGQVRVGISQEVEKYLINWFSNFAANVFQNNWMARNLWKNNNKARRNRSLYLISLKAYRLVTCSLRYTYLKVRRYMLRSISNVLWKSLSGSRQYIGSSKPGNTKTRRMISYCLMFISSNWNYLWNKLLLALIFVVCGFEQNTNQQNKVLALLENLTAKCWKVNNWIIKYNLRSLSPTIIVQMTWNLV